MAMQGRSDLSNLPFLLSGKTVVREAETILQDAARATVLKKYTVMAQVAATGKWVPLTDVTKTTGEGVARGIYMGDDIAAAALVAGDVLNCPILVGADCATFDSSQLVLENNVTLATAVAAATVNAHQVQDDLARIGLYAETTVDIDSFENS